MLQIDSKAHQIAKGYGVPVEQVYKAIDFYPEGFVSEFGSDAEGSDFAYSDVMRDLQVLEKQLVPEQDRKYGGARLFEFMRNEDALFGFLGPKPKPAGAGGEVVKGKEIVLREEMGYVDKLIGWIGRHKALSALGIASLFGLGLYATNDTVKNKVDKYYEKGSKFVREKYASLGAEPAAVAVNESAVATATPAPNYDYYDEEFKVGIMIEGLDKQNVTEMFKTMKEVAPNRYKEVIPYAAKKIVRSTGNYNYNWPQGDEIGLEKRVEIQGRSENKAAKINAAAILYTEERGIKLAKTGEDKQFKNNYEAEMFQNQGVADFNVEAGIWTQDIADAYLKRISEELKSGEYHKKYS